MMDDSADRTKFEFEIQIQTDKMSWVGLEMLLKRMNE